MPAEALSSDHRESAPQVDIAVDELIDLYGNGLTSVDGARKIVDAIKARTSVKTLNLSLNSLEDDGCRELFRFLCTEGGRRYEIAVINLSWNGIGDNGLEAIAEYLVGNEHLKKLYLQDNEIQGDEAIALKFISAINASSLELLSLAANLELSDPFFITFFSHLDPPALHELVISDSGITSKSGPALTSFLTSRRSRALETLGCKNYIDRIAIHSLAEGIRKSNFTLQNLEVDYLRSRDVFTDEDDDVCEAVYDSIALLDHLLRRNEMLRLKTHREALLLLTYSRILSFRPSQLPLHESPESPRGSTQPESQPTSVSPVPASPFPFHALPAELQQQVLAFLTPTLSTAQRHRVYRSAASPATLRLFLPPLLGVEAWLLAPPGKCECESLSDECMGAEGSMECRRNYARASWLEEVGCTRFEPAKGLVEADVQRLLGF